MIEAMEIDQDERKLFIKEFLDNYQIHKN